MTIRRRSTASFLAAVTLLTSPLVRPIAAADPTKEEIVKLVLDRYRANYVPVKTIQATIETTSAEPKRSKPVDTQPKKIAVAPTKPDANVGGTATLIVATNSGRKWTVVIGGVNERYEEEAEGIGYKIVLRKQDRELDYLVGEYARLVQISSDSFSGLHFDPRQAMLWDRRDTIERLLTSEKVRRAEIVTGDDGGRMARIEVKCPSPYVTVLECPESNGYLPTTAYHIEDGGVPDWDGVVQAATVVEYGRHTIADKTILFPKRIVMKLRRGDKTHQTEGFLKRPSAEYVLNVKEDLKLKKKPPDDAFKCPFIVPGTSITNQAGPDPGRIPPTF
jgi:hypothetical protein